MTIRVRHAVTTGAAANPDVLVDGPAWDADHTVTGLENVDNTSDVNKPISTATQAALDLKAPLASPTFTGDPKAPTPAGGDNDTSIATTAFVQAALDAQAVQFDSTQTLTAAQQLVARSNIGLGPCVPGGRITLTTGVPVTASDVTAATSIYYSACGGQYAPVYDGSGWRLVDVSSDLSLALDSNSGHTGYQQSGKNFDVWVAYVSGTTYFGTGPAWNAGAGAGSDTARGTGAASTELQMKNGILTNKNTMTLRFGTNSGDTVSVPANQATLLGSIRMTADGQTEDSFAKRFVSNIYNARIRPMLRIDTTDSWNYSVAAF